MSKHRSVIVAAWALSILGAFTANTASADLPKRIQVGEHRLVLNGWGVRTKTFLQLYSAGLYLTQPSSNPAAIVSANQPMAIRIEITSRFVSQEKLVTSLAEGFHAATDGNLAPIRRQIDQFRGCFKDDITRGDVFDMVYIPTSGVVVNKNGQLKGVVPGADFKTALFKIWLSDKPVDENLKQAMLSNRRTR